MPTMPSTLCSHSGCQQVATHGNYCQLHQPKHNNNRTPKQAKPKRIHYPRASSHERGYTWEWRQAALRFLNENPLCKCCLEDETITAATVVDHIIPHRGDETIFWDKSNWQSMCKPCHDHKTIYKDRKLTDQQVQALWEGRGKS